VDMSSLSNRFVALLEANKVNSELRCHDVGMMMMMVVERVTTRAMEF